MPTFLKYILICMMLVLSASPADAASRDVYMQALQLAAQGYDDRAVAMLDGAAAMLPDQNMWQQRMRAAATLLRMKAVHGLHPVGLSVSTHAKLLGQYLDTHVAPEKSTIWVIAVLAALLPGSGHAWLHRWHDAAVAAILVWPMLLLTFWAWKRHMGPVTVFFCLLTLWLWSGTIFSAVSLAERGGMEAYILWWQGLWQASGLPGKPW